MIDQPVKKFIESKDASKYEVWTDAGWQSIKSSNKTILYDVWGISSTTCNLSAADTHILYDENNNPKFLKDFKEGDGVITEKGVEYVKSIYKTDADDNMYDLELADNSTHTYYASGFKNHNTTMMTIYALWFTMFNEDKTVLIVANRENTAIEILRRIRMAYELMPNWLKPGVKEYGKTSLVFSNDSRIMTSSTSSSSSRGATASCLTGEQVVTVRSKKTGDVMDISLENLANLIKANGKELQINLIGE